MSIVFILILVFVFFFVKVFSTCLFSLAFLSHFLLFSVIFLSFPFYFLWLFVSHFLLFSFIFLSFSFYFLWLFLSHFLLFSSIFLFFLFLWSSLYFPLIFFDLPFIFRLHSLVFLLLSVNFHRSFILFCFI